MQKNEGSVLLCLLVSVTMSWMALGCSGCATGQKRGEQLKQLFAELKGAQEQQKLEELMKALKMTVPTTAEEIKVLGQEMEGQAYAQAQELMSKVTDKTLVPAMLEVYVNKLTQVRRWSDKDLQGMTEAEVRETHKKLGNAEVLITVFGELKDPRTIAALKEALDYELLRYQASTALGQIGDEKTLDELMQRVGKEKDINVASFGDKALTKIVNEINDPNTSPQRRGALTQQIPASTKPETVAVLKDLALNSPYDKVRDRAGLALVNSAVLDGKIADPEFMVKWVEMAKDRYWGVTTMRIHWDPSYAPIVIKILREDSSFATRGEAANALGVNKVAEAVPALEQALLDDDGGVRSSAWGALESILGHEKFIEECENKYNSAKYIHPKDRHLFPDLFPQTKNK